MPILTGGWPGVPVAGTDPRYFAAVINKHGSLLATVTGNQGGVSNIGNTAGTTAATPIALQWVGGNNITLSQSTGTNSDGRTVATVSIVGAAAAAFSGGASNLGNTAGSTGVTGTRLVFVGSNNVTLSQSTDANGGTISFNAGGGGGFSAGVSTGGNTQGNTGVTGTRLVLVGTNNITLSQNTDANGATVSISGQAPAGGAFSGGVSNLGNTAGSTGVTGTRLVLVGTNAISLSQSTDANGGTVSINFTQSAESNTLGMSNLGNTLGTSGVVSGNQVRYLFAGGNNITLSQSLNGASGTVTISAPNQVTESNTFGMSNLGNTSGTSGVISGSGLQMIIVGTNNITVSQSINGSSATLSISGPSPATLSFWEPFMYIGNNTATDALGNASWQFKYVGAAQNYSLTRGNIFVSFSISTITNNSTRTGSFSVWMGLYTRNASSLSLASSGSALHTFTFSSNQATSATGLRRVSVPITLSVTPGDYWIAIATRSSGSNASFTGNVFQHAGVAAFNGDWAVAAANSNQILLGHGVYSASSTAVPGSVAFSQITGSNATTQRYPIFNLQNFFV